MNMQEKRAQGRRNREKGKRFEREVAKMVREMVGEAARRGEQAGGAYSSDVVMRDFWVECKVGARPSIHLAIEQACADAKAAGSLRTPIVISKRDREDVLVTMKFSSFAALLAKANGECIAIESAEALE